MTTFPLLFYIFCCVVGGAGIVMAHGLRRFEQQWTTPLYRFVLMNHAMAFAFLIITYLTPQLVQNTGSRDLRIDLGMVFALVLVPMMAFCIYFFTAFTRGICREEIGPALRRAFWGYWLVLLVFLLVSEKIYFESGEIVLAQRAAMLFNIGNFSLISWALTRLFLSNRRERDRLRRSMVRRVGMTFAGFFALTLVFRLPPSLAKIDPVIEAGFYFAYVLVPLLMARRFVRTRSEAGDGICAEHPELAAFFRSYFLSPREREIISLVYLGRANAEIADELFISIRTVTTHLSNIYQKTGIKSRVQVLTSVRDAGSGFHMS